MDDEHRFTYFSEACSRVTGVRPETLLGRRRWEVGAPGAELEALQQYLRDLDERSPFREYIRGRIIEARPSLFL